MKAVQIRKVRAKKIHVFTDTLKFSYIIKNLICIPVYFFFCLSHLVNQ